MTVEMTQATTKVDDLHNDVNRFAGIVSQARDDLAEIQKKYKEMYEYYQLTMIRIEQEMKDKLHAYRATWFGGMSEQAIYLKVKPI